MNDLLLTNIILSEKFEISSYDLQQHFREFNRKYFDNQIRFDTVLKWGRTTTGGGYATAKIRRNRAHPNEMELLSPIKIVISKSYYISDDAHELIGTLLHEMIHAYFYSIGVDCGHNEQFMDMRETIQKKSGIEVPRYETRDVDPERVLPKKFISINVYHPKNSKYGLESFCLYRPSLIIPNVEHVAQEIKKNIGSVVKDKRFEIVEYTDVKIKLPVIIKSKAPIGTLNRYSHLGNAEWWGYVGFETSNFSDPNFLNFLINNGKILKIIYSK